MPCKHVTETCALARSLVHSRRSLSSQPTARRRDNIEADELRESRDALFKMQIAALKVSDHKLNNEVGQKMKAVQQNLQGATEYVSGLPNTVQILHEVPVYVAGDLREIQSRFAEQAQVLGNRLKEVRLHLRDLNLKEYEDMDLEEPEITKDLAEISAMSEEDKEAWMMERRQELNSIVARTQRAVEAHRDDVFGLLENTQINAAWTPTPNPFQEPRSSDAKEVDVEGAGGESEEEGVVTGNWKRTALGEKRTFDGKKTAEVKKARVKKAGVKKAGEKKAEEEKAEIKPAPNPSPTAIFGELWSRMTK